MRCTLICVHHAIYTEHLSCHSPPGVYFIAQQETSEQWAEFPLTGEVSQSLIWCVHCDILCYESYTARRGSCRYYIPGTSYLVVFKRNEETSLISTGPRPPVLFFCLSKWRLPRCKRQSLESNTIVGSSGREEHFLAVESQQSQQFVASRPVRTTRSQSSYKDREILSSWSMNSTTSDHVRLE